MFVEVYSCSKKFDIDEMSAICLNTSFGGCRTTALSKPLRKTIGFLRSMVFGFCTSSKIRIRFLVASFGAARGTVHGGGLAQLDVQYHIDDCCARSWAHLVLHGKFAFKTFDLQDPRMERQRATQGRPELPNVFGNRIAAVFNSERVHQFLEAMHFETSLCR